MYEPTLVDQTRPMRYMSIASALKSKGVTVTYFSSTFRHANKHVRFQEQTELMDEDGVKTVFIKSPSYSKNLSRERIKAHKVYTQNILAYFNQSHEKPDVILCAFPPIDTPLAISNWAKERKIAFAFDIIDPWPDVILRIFPKLMKPFGKILISRYNKSVRKLIDNSTAITAISNQYIEWIKGKKSGGYKTAAFYPTVPFKEVQAKLKEIQREPSEKVRLVYAGNLGIAYDIPCILKAAEVLEKQLPGKTSFIIAGVGEHAGMVERYQEKLDNVKYLGRIGYEELLVQYANADLGLAQYSKGATQSVTYKFFDYLGAGLPILNSLMSEMATLIDDENVGLNNQPEDYLKLAENISFFVQEKDKLKEFSENAVSLTARKGDNDVVYNEFAEFLIGLKKEG